MNSPSQSAAVDALLHKLRQAREARQMSLSDIADATLINIQFLEQLDRGNTTFLPQTYVRAFMREYASVVGLDPDTIMREYDAATGTPAPVAPAPPPSPAAEVPAETAPPPAATPRRDQRETTLRFGPSQLAVGVILVLILIVVVWNITGRTTTSVQEVPFSSVIAENEKQAAPASQESVQATPAAPGRLDSLVLKARTTDTVWIRMVIDKLTPREYLLRPNRTISWKAQEKFLLVAVGNPTAVRFSLNNKDLGPMGRKGATLRNVELNRQTVGQR